MKKLFRDLRLCYNDDNSISIKIVPMEKEYEDKDEEGMGICCYEEVTASAKNIEEALEKVKGIVGLTAKKGEKPRNVIADFLKG